MNIDVESDDFFIPVTTMTIIVKLNDCFIDKAATFHLLPWSMSEAPLQKGRAKCKLPHNETPGSIICLIHNDNNRGIMKKHKGSSFKNSVGIDISIREKNLTLKISPNTIHITGAKSCLQAEEGVKYLIKHLYETQEILNYIDSNREKCLEILQNIKNLVMGDCKRSILEINGIDFEVENPNKHDIKIINIEETEFFTNNSQDDKKIISFLHSFAKDFDTFEDFLLKTEFIISLMSKIKLISHNNIEIKSLEKAMVNYNFNLGFKINRIKLVDAISGFEGFYARYDNVKSHHVTIELYLNKENNDVLTLDKKHRHTFLVYMSGAVTHSGKKNMNLTSKMFIKKMNEIKSIISLDSVNRESFL